MATSPIRHDVESFTERHAIVQDDPKAAVALVATSFTNDSPMTNAELCEALITLIEAFEMMHDNLGQLGLFADISVELANRVGMPLPSKLTVETSASMSPSLTPKDRSASIENIIGLTRQACS